MGILGLGRKKKVQVEEVAPEPVVEEPTGPALMLLIPEVAGGTSFRALKFRGAADAAEHLATMLPAAVANVHAFWAMLDHPGESSEGGEALVLMRSETEGDLVYAVSFVDIESAISFARFEVKRGMSIGQVMVYWAELVTISRTEDGHSLSPAEPPAITPEAMAAAMAYHASSPSLEKARRRQEEEKNRLQAELEEIRQRQAQTEELHERQAQIEDKRKQLELAEKARRQTKAEEQKRLQAEAKEIERLRAEAEELRKRQEEAEAHERKEAQTRRLQAEKERQERLQAAAEEERRLQEELEEIERQQALAEERERQQAAERAERAAVEEERRRAEAEEMIRLQAEAQDLAEQLAEEMRLLAQEEKGRRHAERKAKPRLEAEAELTKLLQEELKDIKQKQIEAESRWNQEATERRLLAEAEEEKRRKEEEEKRRLEEAEAAQLQAQLEEIKRQQAEATEWSHATEEEEERAGRLQVGIHQIKLQQIEAQERWRQEAEERRLRAEAEERERRELEDEKRRMEVEETRAIQAQLQEIRHRLTEAHVEQPDGQVIATEAGVQDTQSPQGREGGVTTNWVRKSPGPLETEPVQTESEAAREFTLQPNLDRAPFTPGGQSAEESPVESLEEPPVKEDAAPDQAVREFSLEPDRSAPLWAADTPGASVEVPDKEDHATEHGSTLADDLSGGNDASESPEFVADKAVVGEALEEVPTPDAGHIPADPGQSAINEPAATDEDSENTLFEGDEPVVAEPPAFLRDDNNTELPVEDWPDEPLTPQTPQEAAEFDESVTPEQRGERFEVTLEAEDSPEQAPEPDAETERQFSLNPTLPESNNDLPMENPIGVGANGHNGLHEAGDQPDGEPPETIPGEEDLSPEMAAFLKSRRRDAKDNPFKGFDSPPGRF